MMIAAKLRLSLRCLLCSPIHTLMYVVVFTPDLPCNECIMPSILVFVADRSHADFSVSLRSRANVKKETKWAVSLNCLGMTKTPV